MCFVWNDATATTTQRSRGDVPCAEEESAQALELFKEQSRAELERVQQSAVEAGSAEERAELEECVGHTHSLLVHAYLFKLICSRLFVHAYLLTLTCSRLFVHAYSPPL